MEKELCNYCEKDLKDPENIVIGTFRFRGPRMYHLDCYEKMKLDSTWKKVHLEARKIESGFDHFFQ